MLGAAAAELMIGKEVDFKALELAFRNASSMKNQILQKNRRCMWIFMMAFLAHPSPTKGTC
jgi:hypothetical protein